MWQTGIINISARMDSLVGSNINEREVVNVRSRGVAGQGQARPRTSLLTTRLGLDWWPYLNEEEGDINLLSATRWDAIIICQQADTTMILSKKCPNKLAAHSILTIFRSINIQIIVFNVRRFIGLVMIPNGGHFIPISKYLCLMDCYKTKQTSIGTKCNCKFIS